MGDEKAWFIGSLAGYFGINPNSKTTTFNKLFKKYDLRFRLLNKHTKVDGKNVRYLKIEENKE